MSEETFSSLSDDPPLLSQNQTHDLTSSDFALNKIYFKVFLHLHRLAQCFASAHEYFAIHTFFCFTRTLIALLHLPHQDSNIKNSSIHPSVHQSKCPSKACPESMLSPQTTRGVIHSMSTLVYAVTLHNMRSPINIYPSVH